MAEHEVINGIDVTRLREAMDTMKGKAEFAKLRLRAHNEWVNGTHCRTTIKDFNHAGEEYTARKSAFVLDADEPEVLLGEDYGPNATEAALHALASCLNTTFMYHASARGVKVHELVIDLEGELDLRGLLGISQEVRNGFSAVHATFHVKADATPEQIRELCELAQQRSPVFDIFTQATPVTASVDVQQKTEREAA